MRKIPSLVILLLLACLIFTTACNTASSAPPAATTAAAASTAAPAASTAAAAQSAEPAEPEEGIYPIVMPDGSQLELTIWRRWSQTIVSGWAENRMYQEMQEKTGVKIDWLTPPEATWRENFQLSVASAELPDIYYNPPTYTGGNQKGVDDGVYIDMTPLMDEWAPNYMRWLNADAQINKEARLDDGRIISMQQVQLTSEAPWRGPWIRTDLLEKIDKPIPETVDEWTEVLRLFKSELGIEYPYVHWKTDNFFDDFDSAFASAFDAYANWINVNGTAKYGYVQPGWIDYITYLNGWFKEGLIDPDFDTMDSVTKDAKFATGKSAAKIDAYGDAGIWIQSGQIDNPEFMIEATPYPVRNKGDNPKDLHIRQENYRVRGNPSYVTTDCKNPEYAMRFIDFSYTVDGFLMNNYGVEGESWEWADGEPADNEIGYFPPELKGTGKHPVFTELMTNNPDGFEFWAMVHKYKTHNGTHLRSPMAYLIGPEAMSSMEIWASAGTDYFWPQTMFTTDEARRQSELETDIKAYRDQMIVNMIKGIEPLSSWDTYLATMEQLGVPEWESIRQASLDRYMQR